MKCDISVGIATRNGLDGPGIESLPIPVAEWSKARVCGRSLAGIAGSNPAAGMDVCCECRTVRTKGKSQENQDKEVQIKYREKEKTKQNKITVVATFSTHPLSPYTKGTGSLPGGKAAKAWR